jgi:hypothetical protein
VHAGVYEVDFGGVGPIYVEALMPSCDGLVEVMEAGDVKNVDGGGEIGSVRGLMSLCIWKRRRWRDCFGIGDCGAIIEIYHQPHAFGKGLCDGESIFFLAELPKAL